MIFFEEIRPGLRELYLPPFSVVNVFLAGDVLIDSGPLFTAKRILHALSGYEVNALALTHGHFDHQGGAHAVCNALSIPLWCGEGDRKAVESGELNQLLPRPQSLIGKVAQPLAGPAHPPVKNH